MDSAADNLLAFFLFQTRSQLLGGRGVQIGREISHGSNPRHFLFYLIYLVNEDTCRAAQEPEHVSPST